MNLTPEQQYQARQLIDEQLDMTIIPSVMKLIDDTEVYRPRERERDTLTNSQLSGLQNVTRDTQSVYAILTWIRYQIGRYKSWSNKDNKEFGKLLVERLSGLDTLAIQIARKLTNNDQKAAELLVRPIWLLLIQHYVGHLRRYFVAKGGTK